METRKKYKKLSNEDMGNFLYDCQNTNTSMEPRLSFSCLDVNKEMCQGDEKPVPGYEGLVQQVEGIDRQSLRKHHCDV